MVTGLFNAGFPMVTLRRSPAPGWDMDRLFGRALAGWPRLSIAARSGRVYPAINVWEDEENLYAEAEVPGIKLEHIEVTVVGDELTVAGERKAPYGEETAFHRRERGFGTFRRVIGLPGEVDAERVFATLNHGVLRITLPKAEAAKPRKIEVKSLTK